MGLDMANEAGDGGEEDRERGSEGGDGVGYVVRPAQEADYVDHADLAQAAAVGAGMVAVGVGAAPDAQEEVAGLGEGGEGVGDGGGDREGADRRLPQAEVGDVITQQAHCHATTIQLPKLRKLQVVC